jgi:TPR repeat protein
MNEYGFVLAAFAVGEHKRGGGLMAFCSSPRNSIRWLSVVFLLSAISAQAAPNTQDEHPASVAELQTKAAQGFVIQEMELAADYFVGRGVPKDLAQAAYWYRKAADQGNPSAQMNLGYLYVSGIGVTRDPAEGAKWYRRASTSIPDAKVNLATLYLRGSGVERDTDEALRLLQSPAEKGDGRADAYLGLANYLGSGIPVDRAVAEEWFIKGVRLNDPEAECLLALWDAEQPGRAPDLAREAELLRLSVASGYVEAMHALGLLLVRHPDLPQEKGEATDTLLAAASAGSWQSSAAMGVLARDGRLMQQDPRAAYRWFRIAALQGGSPAESYLHGELARLAMCVPDSAAAEQEAAAWLQVHPNHDVFAFKEELNPKYFPIQEVYATAQAPDVEEKAGQPTEQHN